MIEFNYNDGGRAEAGYKGSTGDCACRAIAIATDATYSEAYELINKLAKSERIGKRKKSKSNARTGVYIGTMKKVMTELGWTWYPTMKVGQGCKVHLSNDELPSGNLIVRLSRHYAAVVNGVLNDTYDSSRGGSRWVYGYWKKD